MSREVQLERIMHPTCRIDALDSLQNTHLTLVSVLSCWFNFIFNHEKLIIKHLKIQRTCPELRWIQVNKTIVRSC